MEAWTLPHPSIDYRHSVSPSDRGSVAMDTGAPVTERSERGEALVMVGKIAAIVFAIETGIMTVLEQLTPTLSPLTVDLLDATTLTLLASPLIYYGVARPFAVTARQASKQLRHRIAEMAQLLDQNEKLRTNLQQASSATADAHERILQKIGGDLHDGPAQILTFALLQLDRLRPACEAGGDGKWAADYRRLKQVLGDVLREIRGISMGLALPELDETTMRGAIELAAVRHQELTDAAVYVDVSRLPAGLDTPLAYKVCVYRIVQEALTNASRHGGGKRQVVTAAADARVLKLVVEDDGLGFEPAAVDKGLGLLGMRARVQAIGGQLDIEGRPGVGARVTARFALTPARIGVEAA